MVACGARNGREGLDAVIPVVATIRRGVEAGRSPTEAIVIGAADGVLGIGRVDGDRGLVLWEARVILVGLDVIAAVRQLLDLVFRALVERLRLVVGRTCLGTLCQRVPRVDVAEVNCS